MNFSNRN